MRAGKPTGAKTKPARQSRARNADATTAGLTDPDQKPKGPRKRYPSDKKSFLSLLLDDARLGPEEKAAIRTAHKAGVSLADVAAMIVYEFAMARKFMEAGELDPKDFIIAANKAASHATAAAQLGQDGGATAAKVEITFVGTGPQARHPDSPVRKPAHAVIGDVIDADG